MSTTKDNYLSNIHKSICNISHRKVVAKMGGHVYSDKYGGHGVFILPDVVLTSWHVISGSEDMTITNSDGETAKLVGKSSSNKFRKDLDIALFEIDRPLTGHPALFASNDDIFRKEGGFVMSNFDSKLEFIPARLDMLSHMFNSFAQKDTRQFNLDGRVYPGYSGSPILDAQGRIVSVVTHAVYEGGVENSSKEERGKRGSNVCKGPAVTPLANLIRRSIF